jgi:hypothetical protein
MTQIQEPAFLPIDKAREYLVAEINSLRHIKGTVWVYVCAATMLDYLASLSIGAPAKRQNYIDFIRDHMRPAYKNFEYARQHQKPGTGSIPSEMTKQDLPEQMYYMLRCGLVHGFSLVPTQKELLNGGRDRSITINSRADALKDEKTHLEPFNKPPLINDSVYFVDEDLLDDLVAAVNHLFADVTKHPKIKKRLMERPFIWPL